MLHQMFKFILFSQLLGEALEKLVYLAHPNIQPPKNEIKLFNINFMDHYHVDFGAKLKAKQKSVNAFGCRNTRYRKKKKKSNVNI